MPPIEPDPCQEYLTMDFAFLSDFLSNASTLFGALDFFSGSADALSETPEATGTA